MIEPTALLIAILAIAGIVTGLLGSLLGIGGGMMLVPFLVLVLGFPSRTAVGIGLVTVIATSTAVSANTAGRQLINLRLGMLLEVATAAGGLTGGLAALLLSPSGFSILFGVVTLLVAGVMVQRLERRNVILDDILDPGMLGGRFHEDESGGTVVYRIKRLPVALLASFVAGNLSTMLGIGGGVLKVPALNAWCGVPMRAAAATSAFMIGVTATTGAVIYYVRGDIIPSLAAAAVLGVMAGSRVGSRLGVRAAAKHLKLLLVAVLLLVSVLMFVNAA